MNKTCLILYLLLGLSHISKAQNPFIKNYTIADGLPTNKIIHIYRDSKGFMWFTTDSGVIRFDGSSFINFSVDDGLSDNVVMRMKEDLQGRLWFFNLNGTTNYFYENTFYNSENAPFLNELKTRFYLINFFQDADSTLYFYNTFSEVFAIKNNELVDYKNFGFNNLSDAGLHYFNKSEEDRFLLWTSQGIYSTTEIDGELTLNRIQDGILRVFEGKKYDNIVLDRSFFIHFFDNGKMIQEKAFQTETQFINSIIVDQEGYIWVATFDKGVFCYKDNELILYLDIKSAQGLLPDNENNIWITSSSSGIYKINREILKFKFFPKSHFLDEGLTDLAPANNGGIWTTNGKSLFMICNQQLFPARIDIHGNILNNICQLRDNTVIIHGNSTEMYIIPDVICNQTLKTFHSGKLKTIYHTVKKIAIDPAEEFLYSFVNERLIQIELKNNFWFNTIRLNQAGRINNVFIDHQNQVVINATKNFYYTPDSFYYIEDLEPYNGLTITSHLKLNDETDLYNFIGNRLILMHKHNHFELTEKLRSMIDYRIKDMVYDGSTLFFFTSRTVYFISNPMEIIENKPLQLNRLNIEFNNINDIVCHDNTLYIATDDGLVLIPVEECIDAQVLKPKPYFSKVYLDDIEYNFNPGAVEFKNKRRLTIEFGSQNYSSFPSNYSYMLEGIDKNWIEGNELRVVYLNLPPGNYTFKLKARKGMEDYSEVIELPIRVNPTFFQRTSTLIILSLLIALLIYWIVRFFYRIQIKKKETDSLLITLEHKALQSMMNPHFIFNALGSIQRYLLQNKAEEAGTYLSQFARLIRQNMNSLKSNSISIDDEVERLKNYLELEKLRMNHKFEYTLEVDEKMDGDEIEIPSMIVQPFVENAIWHGISPLEGEGKITVKFEANDEKSIAIVIEDNGIGMTRTKTFSKSEQNLNMGVSITEKRLKLIGERLKMNSEIITEELFPGTVYPGTRIILLVPIIPFSN